MSKYTDATAHPLQRRRPADAARLDASILMPDGEYVSEDDLERDALAFVGTCQWCGAYWDVRQRAVCPCGGEVL